MALMALMATEKLWSFEIGNLSSLICRKSAEFTTRPDLMTPLEEEEGRREQKNADTAEDGAAPVDADLLVHGPYE